jgi:hypothetical protein
MNLFKIMCLCVIGTSAFSMEEDVTGGEANERQKSPTVHLETAVDTKKENVIAADEKEQIIQEMSVWIGIQKADALISKGADKFNAIIEKNPQLQSVTTKIAPYLSSVHTFTENADQKMFLAFVAGSVLSQNKYLYLITLPTSAYYAERSLNSIAEAWRISGEEKKSIITIQGFYFDARELFVTAGAIAMLLERDIYSATFLGGAYALAYLTRDNKEKLFDAGSFLAYVILLNALYSLDL